MSNDVPDRVPIRPLLVELRVRRNAGIGFGVGVVCALLAYVYRVVIVDPAPGAVDSPWLFATLAVVLAIAFGSFVALVLTAITAVHRAREDG